VLSIAFVIDAEEAIMNAAAAVVAIIIGVCIFLFCLYCFVVEYLY
jgi:hypothetical protein